MSGVVRCRICGNEHVTVAPVSTNLENMECALCHGMTCDRVDLDEDIEFLRGQIQWDPEPPTDFFTTT